MVERIWVVDDDHGVRFVLVAALREAGYAVQPFASADEALRALASQLAPALLFTDVRMPGDNGLVLLEKLKAAGIRAEIDLRNEKINYKVREHSLAKVPVMFVVGKREAEEQKVAIRRLGDEKQSFDPLESAIQALAESVKPPY